MKYFTVAVILATLSVQAASALKCMQGIEVVQKNSKETAQKEEKLPEITECGALTAVASTALLFTVKPSTISFPSGDYKCYHLKYDEKNNDASTIIKGCIYKSLDVCDGKFSTDGVKEAFCSQCNEDGCNSGGRFGFDLKLLGLTLAAVVAYLLK
uniref:Putative 12-14 kDa mosquito protein n=1 Tax=Psorophora albipes TaxID=869069 RepID=T1D565_9DIPT